MKLLTKGTDHGDLQPIILGDEKGVTYRNEKDRLKDMRFRKIANIKYNLYMRWHRVYWKLLHITLLARPYSKLMCKLGLYRKYADGRCNWCGKIH